jgi:prephenate dehydrogenase
MKRLSEMTTLIVGLGQIGGSIGLDLVAGRVVARVIGFDSHKAVMTKALQRKAVDHSVANLRAGLANADLVILATPIDATLRLLPSILELLPAGSLCLDVASTKQEMLQTVEKLKPKAGYISTHPIAGTEGIGIDSTVAGLFKDKVFTITPASSAKPAQIRLVKQLATALGASPLLIGAKRHDRLLAQTSHLPYAIATALVQVAGETGESDKLLRRLAGGSFASATRVANSSPELTQNLLLSNRAEVSKAIARMESELSGLRKMLQRNDADGLQQYVKAAHRLAKKGKK